MIYTQPGQPDSKFGLMLILRRTRPLAATRCPAWGAEFLDDAGALPADQVRAHKLWFEVDGLVLISAE